MSIPRLYLKDRLDEGAVLKLSKPDSHYVLNVMRLQNGAEVRVFNADDGEWRTRLEVAGKKAAHLHVANKTRAAQPPADIWLLFAPVKRDRTDLIVEKATEMGASKIQAVITMRTNSGKTRPDRMQSIAKEAAEQTERFDIPEIEDAIKLARLLEYWDPSRTLIFADEAGDAKQAVKALKERRCEKAAILIGPEGGFDPKERALLRDKKYVLPVSLGPRILRADTAVIAALGAWQATNGDWD